MSYSLKKTGYIDQISGEVIIIDLIEYIDSLENKFEKIEKSKCVFLDKKVFEKSNLIEGYYYQINLCKLDTVSNENNKENDEITISANIAKRIFDEIEDLDIKYKISFQIDRILTQNVLDESKKLNKRLDLVEKITSFFMGDNQDEEELLDWKDQLKDLKDKVIIRNHIKLNDHNDVGEIFQQVLGIYGIGILKTSQIMHIIEVGKYPVFSKSFYELLVYLGYCKESKLDNEKYKSYQIIVNKFISERLKYEKEYDEDVFTNISFQLYKFNLLDFIIS